MSSPGWILTGCDLANLGNVAHFGSFRNIWCGTEGASDWLMSLELETEAIKRGIRRPELTEVVVRDSWHCIAVSSGIVCYHFLHILVTSHYQHFFSTGQYTKYTYKEAVFTRVATCIHPRRGKPAIQWTVDSLFTVYSSPRAVAVNTASTASQPDSMTSPSISH